MKKARTHSSECFEDKEIWILKFIPFEKEMKRPPPLKKINPWEAT